MRDIWCVAWKELMLARRNAKTYVTSYIFVLVIWGFLFPAALVDNIWQGDTTASLLAFVYLSVLLASGQTISAFVGERMQKTLGTLLTTRLSDAAIFLGKVLAIIVISYGLMLVVFAIHMCTVWYVAMMKFHPSRFPYSPLETAFMLLMPIFTLIYTSALGVYISLKSTNIRGQHFLNLFMGIPVIGALVLVLKSLSWPILLLSCALFGLVCAGLAGFSIGRFNRQRLILM